MTDMKKMQQIQINEEHRTYYLKNMLCIINKYTLLNGRDC